jgi:hypothetical protein
MQTGRHAVSLRIEVTPQSRSEGMVLCDESLYFESLCRAGQCLGLVKGLMFDKYVLNFIRDEPSFIRDP